MNFLKFTTDYGTFNFVKVSKYAPILNNTFSIELFKNLGFDIIKPINEVLEEDLFNKIGKLDPSIPCTTPFIDYRKGADSSYFNCSTRLKSFKTIIEFLKIDTSYLKEDEQIIVLFLKKE